MYKSCAKCGKIHDTNYKCNVGRVYTKSKESELRNTTAWVYKAKEIKEKANYLCEVCKDKGIYNYKNLEVHHITKLKDAPDKLLDNDNLICLCTYHHKLADKNEIDKDYLLMLAKKREDNN